MLDLLSSNPVKNGAPRQLKARTFPLTIESPGSRWTLSVHANRDGEFVQANANLKSEKNNPPPKNPKFSLKLVRVERDIELAKEYSTKSILRRFEKMETDRRALTVFPSSGKIPAKPPTNILTYLALSERGLGVIKKSGFLKRAREAMNGKSNNNNSSQLERRAFIWSIAHIASSDIGAAFLLRNRSLQGKKDRDRDIRLSVFCGYTAYQA